MAHSRRSRWIRRPCFEALDARQLLAADLGIEFRAPALVESLSSPVPPALVANLGEGEDQAQATDLIALARAISQSGAKFYGAAWCTFCTQQKELFADGQYYLPFVEVTNPDRTLNAVGQAANITSFPTWVFPDGSRETGVQSLETLAQRSGVAITQSNAPELLPLPDLVVQAGSPRWIALDGFDPNLDGLTYTVTTDNPNLVALQVPQGNRSLLVEVKSWGKMTFQLFDNLVPKITDRIANLAQAGYYNKTATNNSIVTHVVQSDPLRYIQLGDPSGNGTASSGLGPVDDQFDARLQHNAAGYLSLIKSGDDTGDAQFFVTDGPARLLDFDYPIFGMLTEGDKNRDAINDTATTAERPNRDIVINSVQVIQDNENAVLMISAPAGAAGTANVTVTVQDPGGHSFQRTFKVTVEPDTANSGPFLRAAHTQVTSLAQPVSWPLASVDVEGDAVRYEASLVGSGGQVSVDAVTGRVTVTPDNGFIGTLEVLTGVRAAPGVANDTADPLDAQVISVLVQPNPLLWHNLDFSVDTNGDGIITPRDALIIINELNSRTLSNAAGEFTGIRPEVGIDFLFYDTSGDNLLTSRDALLVVNRLNGVTDGEGEGEAPIALSVFDAALAALWADEDSSWARARRGR